MGFVDFILFGLGLGLTSGICTWIISHRSAFKRGLIVGLERGHREGFDVGYQAGLSGLFFGKDEEQLNSFRQQTIEEIDYRSWAEDVPTAEELRDSFEPKYECKEVFAPVS